MIKNAGVIIENPAFLDGETGFKNLDYLYRINNKRDKAAVRKAIEKVGLDPDLKKKVKHYSLGMRQRLAIAQAIMEDPDILILDEPMNGLDKKGVEEMRILFMELKEQGKTILLASHNKEDIDILCDQVYEMEMGVLHS
jgi:ABC-2 type transport system ATP-binding protein